MAERGGNGFKCSLGTTPSLAPDPPEPEGGHGHGTVNTDTPTVRRSGMKRSSSENATNLGRGDGEHLVFAEPNVTKPWKQRFSFRQPRKEQVPKKSVAIKNDTEPTLGNRIKQRQCATDIYLKTLIS